jgi:hypothetical protein
MPPDSTQNLNAKLSARSDAEQRQAESGIRWEPSPIQHSSPPVRIVGAASSYRGGYLVRH